MPLRNIYIVIIVDFISLGFAFAQKVDYETMKGQLDESSLPLVNLIVDIDSVGKSYFTEGEIEISDFFRRTDATTETVKFHCQLRYRGATAATFEKKSFAIKLYDENGNDLDANIMGIREENSWILDAMAIDRIRMRNRVCFDCWNEISKTPYNTNYGNRNGTLGYFVEVFINGNYNGLYCMTDKIDRKLLGLKKTKNDLGGAPEIRGLLYKGIGWGYSGFLLGYDEMNVDSTEWNSWELQYPDNYPSIYTWKPLMDLINFCSSPLEDFKQEYLEYFYGDNIIDYLILTCALNVGDNGYKNTFLSTVDINKGHCYLITPWDMDMSLGGYFDGEYDESLASTDRYNNIPPFRQLYAHNTDDFKARVKKTWEQYRSTTFSIRNIERRLDDYAKLFIKSGAWAREYDKWNNNPVPLKENIQDEIQYVKNWYERNYKNMCAQLITDIKTNVIPMNTNNKIYTIEGKPARYNTLINNPRGYYILNGRKILKTK